MITLTALNHLRCSLRPELIASVETGASTVVLLRNGLTLAVRESADEVRRLIQAAGGLTGVRAPAGADDARDT